MPVAAAISVEEYLGTTYRPDRDYIDGEVLERNVGEVDHSFLQTALAAHLWNRRVPWGITPLTEVRVQVKPTRFRVPDVTVVAGPKPKTRILREPPLLCIEVLSPEAQGPPDAAPKTGETHPSSRDSAAMTCACSLGDRTERTQETIEEYLAFGVPCVWLVNPRTRRGFIYTSEGMHEAKDGILRVAGTPIEVPLAGLE
jgi:Uma2 family endonuclease